MSVEGSSRVALICALLLGLILAAPVHGGLGLGEARIQSYLGQPLDVRIALLQPSESALESLTVEVASEQDHARLGVPVEALAFGLSVELDQSVDPPVIRLRSGRAVNDPFVQILVNARWASGRMLREYTLFLDPPSVPVAPPIRRRDDPPTPAEPAPAPEAEAAPAEPAPPPPAQREAAPAAEPSPPADSARQTIGPVESGQTLWSIATAWRPDDSLSMNQVMLAILDRNPDAFINNNVNRLRRGARLTMPDASEVQAIAPAQAERRIREQAQAWEALRARPAAVPAAAEAPQAPPVVEPEPVVAPDPDPEPTPADPAAASAEEAQPTAEQSPEAELVSPLPRLELTPPAEDVAVDTQALGVERELLEERLEVLEQEIRAERLDSEELAADVDQIRQAIDSADAGGLMVAREDLALLEQQLREARLERQAQAAQEQEPAPTEPAPVGAAPEPAPAPAATGSPVWLWPAVAAAVAIVLLILVLAAVMRRRRSAADEPVAEESTAADPVEPAGAAVAAVGLDAQLAALYRLADQDDRDGFASAFEHFEAEVVDPSDPRWVEANDLARQVIPGHPLVQHGQSGPDDPEPDETDEDAEALFHILDSDDESAPDEEVSGPDFGDEERLDQPRESRESEEDADLARLSNRLDEGERDGVERDHVALAEDEATALFAEPGRTSVPEEDEDADEPLSLDFDFSSREEPGEEIAGEPGIEWEIDPSAPDSASESVPPADEAQPRREDAFDTPAAERDEEFRPMDPEIDPEIDPGSEEDGDEVDDWFTIGEDDAAPEESQPEAEPRAGAALSDDDAEVKMDLARAYLSMDDVDSARALLEEIVADGSETHREQARRLLDELK